MPDNDAVTELAAVLEVVGLTDLVTLLVFVYVAVYDGVTEGVGVNVGVSDMELV